MGISQKYIKHVGRIRNNLDRPVTLWGGSITLGTDPQHFGQTRDTWDGRSRREL